jgi:drug/metabolite transporter (DMT)-like permease
VLLGLATAFAATVCFGLASAVQARGARSAPRAEGRRGLHQAVGLVRSWQFLLGTALDAVGFVFSVFALRSLPLFVVQAVTNASLAVTAVAAVPLLGIRVRPRDGAAIAAVIAGLVLLAIGSGRQGDVSAGLPFRLALLAAPLAALGLTALAARRHGDGAATALGALSGIGFGVTSLAVRVADISSVGSALADVATYALVIGGLGGYLSYALAMRHGSVTAATAAGTLVEVCAPGLIGVWVLHDHARPGHGWLALSGFLVAAAGTLALSRFGEVSR